jgi:hypothetical protein
MTLFTGLPGIGAGADVATTAPQRRFKHAVMAAIKVSEESRI